MTGTSRWLGAPLRAFEQPGTRVALACLLFAAALFYRSPGLLTGPRFWAEEGRYYYSVLQDGVEWDWLTLVVRGNYQLSMNLSVALAALFPAAWAAHVTTAAALLLACIPVALLAVLSVQQGWKAWTVMLGVVAIAWLPSGYEIYLTSTNTQWLLSVSVLLLMLLRAQHWQSGWKLAACVWVAICALSGVPSAMLAPLMLGIGVRIRSRAHLVWAALLGCGALVQLTVIATHTHAQRSFTLDPFLAIVPFVAQTFVAPITGVGPVEQYLAWMRPVPRAPALLALIAVAMVPTYGIGRAVAAGPSGVRLPLVLVVAAVFTSMLNVFGAIGEHDELISAWSGGRYFYLATVAWLVLLVAAANLATWPVRLLACVLLLASIYAGNTEIRAGSWKNFLVSGPSWRAAVAACGHVRPCTVQAWPGGADWTFELRRR